MNRFCVLCDQFSQEDLEHLYKIVKENEWEFLRHSCNKKCQKDCQKDLKGVLIIDEDMNSCCVTRIVKSRFEIKKTTKNVETHKEPVFAFKISGFHKQEKYEKLKIILDDKTHEWVYNVFPKESRFVAYIVYSGYSKSKKYLENFLGIGFEIEVHIDGNISGLIDKNSKYSLKNFGLKE